MHASTALEATSLLAVRPQATRPSKGLITRALQQVGIQLPSTDLLAQLHPRNAASRLHRLGIVRRDEIPRFEVPDSDEEDEPVSSFDPSGAFLQYDYAAAATRAPQGPQPKSERMYRYEPVMMNFDTVSEVSVGLGHELVGQKVRACLQDDAMADRIADKVRVEVPEIADGSFLSAPADLGLIRVEGREDQLTAALFEWNGSGHGGPFVLPARGVAALRSTCTHIGERYAQAGKTDVLVTIGCSLGKKPNAYVIDKIQYADWVAEPLRRTFGRDKVEVIFYVPGKTEALLKKRGPEWSEGRKATVVVGYSPQLANAERRVRGRDRFCGRAIDAKINDRYTQVANNRARDRSGDSSPLDHRTLQVNKTVFLATDKHTAYRGWDEFNKARGTDYASTNVMIDSVRAGTEDEVVWAVKAFHAQGKPAISKSFATGNGNGIDTYTDIDESPSNVRKTIGTTVKALRKSKTAGAEGGGFPFTVTRYFAGQPLSVPEGHEFHYANGMIPELRVSAMGEHAAGKAYLFALPEIVKLRDPGSAVGNIHAQMARTGRPAADFVLPLCRQDVLDLLGITEDDVTAMCDRVVQNWVFMLKNQQRFSDDLPVPQPITVTSTRERLMERARETLGWGFAAGAGGVA